MFFDRSHKSGAGNNCMTVCVLYRVLAPGAPWSR